MINSKAQLKEALKQGKNLTFVTIKNEHKPTLIGIERTPGTKQQTNAFTIATEKNGNMVDSWVWYSEVTICNNIIKYKNFAIELQIKEANE